MAFVPYTPEPPDALLSLAITLKWRAAVGPDPETRTANYSLVLIDQYGNVVPHPADTGNLAPHLSPDEIQTIVTFLDAQRVKAQALIP